MQNDEMHLSEAEKIALKSMNMTVKLLGEGNIFTAGSNIMLAQIYDAQERFSEAETLLELGLAIFKQFKRIPMELIVNVGGFLLGVCFK